MSTKGLLLPRVAGKFIAEHSQDIKILPDGVKQTARKILDMMRSHEALVDVSRWKLHTLNPKTCDRSAVDWVFLVDLLNFSFWSEEDVGQLKYAVNYGGHAWTGYWSLCAAVNRAVDEGCAVTDPAVFRTLSREQFEHIVRSDVAGTKMPLIAERLDSLHTAGATLCEKFGGSFVNVIKQSERSAVKLLQLIVEHFPTFRDVAVYCEQPVAIYKRAQILVADIWACCGGEGLGQFDDIDEITAFADYRIPQALVWLGVFQYSDSLLETLRKCELLENGDRREVEIRGCTIWAVELIVEELRRLMAIDAQQTDGDSATKYPRTTVNAILIDHFLWDFRRDHDAELEKIPYHRTRCIYY